MRGSLADHVRPVKVKLEHTRGNWRAIHGPVGLGVYADKELIAAVRFMGGDNSEGVANGTLLAAAPQLRDACIAALVSLTCGGDKVRAVSMLSRALDISDGESYDESITEGSGYGSEYAG